MTRAMLVTVLWRYAGRPEAGKNPFTDVPAGQWYTEAVTWAAENGVVERRQWPVRAQREYHPGADGVHPVPLREADGAGYQQAGRACGLPG